MYRDARSSPPRSGRAVRRTLGGGSGARPRGRLRARTAYHTLDKFYYIRLSLRQHAAAASRTPLALYHQLPGKQVPIFMAYNIIDIDNYDLIIV